MIFWTYQLNVACILRNVINVIYNTVNITVNFVQDGKQLILYFSNNQKRLSEYIILYRPIKLSIQYGPYCMVHLVSLFKWLILCHSMIVNESCNDIFNRNASPPCNLISIFIDSKECYRVNIKPLKYKITESSCKITC